MRVSSLSDDRVRRLLTRYFVPAWVSRDNYQRTTPPREEVALLAKIDRSRSAGKHEGGAVCAHVVEADGTVLASLPVQKACQPELLVRFLRDASAKLTPRSAEDAKPASATPTPKPAKGGRLFAVRTRFDGTTNRGTSRDVVELTREEWGAFVAKGDAKRWPVAAEKLLRLAYPPLPHWDAKHVRLTKCEMTAERVAGGIRLRGRVALVYPDLGKPTDGEVTASVVGFAESDAKTGALTSLVLASEGARYVWHWQGKPQVKPMSFAVELESSPSER